MLSDLAMSATIQAYEAPANKDASGMPIKDFVECAMGLGYTREDGEAMRCQWEASPYGAASEKKVNNQGDE